MKNKGKAELHVLLDLPISDTEIGRRLEVHARTVSRWRKGRLPRRYNLLKLQELVEAWYRNRLDNLANKP